MQRTCGTVAFPSPPVSASNPDHRARSDARFVRLASLRSTTRCSGPGLRQPLTHRRLRAADQGGDLTLKQPGSSQLYRSFPARCPHSPPLGSLCRWRGRWGFRFGHRLPHRPPGRPGSVNATQHTPPVVPALYLTIGAQIMPSAARACPAISLCQEQALLDRRQRPGVGGVHRHRANQCRSIGRPLTIPSVTAYTAWGRYGGASTGWDQVTVSSPCRWV
jgi:hypothetical protein